MDGCRKRRVHKKSGELCHMEIFETSASSNSVGEVRYLGTWATKLLQVFMPHLKIKTITLSHLQYVEVNTALIVMIMDLFEKKKMSWRVYMKMYLSNVTH